MKKMTKQIIEKHKTYLINEEKSSATIEKYARDVLVFIEWIDDAVLDKSAVLKYKQNLIENYAPASVNSMISSLNRFFSYNEGYDLKVKSVKIQKQIFASREKELTKVEYERLLKAAKNKNNQRLYYLMQTICSCGIRVSELKFITADAVKRGQATINCKGKMRMVILPKQLCKMP